MYYSNHDVRLEELPKPELLPDEILMRVEASGICGSDVMEWYRESKVPLVLGHEVAGVVAEAGKNVKRFKIGDRVIAAHHVPCGSCRYCQSGHPTVCETLRSTNFHPGGFSEYIRIPSINVEHGVFLIPNEVPFEEATFTEPLACIIRGQKIAGVKKGDRVLVVGSGISGILHICMAHLNGAAQIIATDVSDYKLNMAKKFGAHYAIDAKSDVPKEVARVNNGMLADVVIICASAMSAIEQALKSVRRGGTVLFFAAAGKDDKIPFPINELFWRTELVLASSYAGSPEDHKEALNILKSKKINVTDMITHKFALADAQKGFELVSDGKDALKVIVEPNR